MASNLILACSSLVLAVLVALTVQIFYFSPIDPVLLEIPPASSASPSIKNNQLQNVIKLGEGLLKDPEDVAVDKEGTLYAVSRDGWIKRLRRNGNWENWKNTDSHTMLGITPTKEGGLIVCDTIKGLLKVTEDGVSVLVSQVNGSPLSARVRHILVLIGYRIARRAWLIIFPASRIQPITFLIKKMQGLLEVTEDGFSVLVSQVNGSQLRFADDVIEASDGSLYFSVASTKFDLDTWYLDVLEARPHGQLLKYNPTSNETVIVLDNLIFANGIALSKDEDYLAICETWKYRCQRYWLKGANKGKTEIFIDNLPGGPDNINLAPDGSFWIALVQLTSEGLESVHTSKVAKHLLASFPWLTNNLVIGVKKKATVVNVATNGKIIRKFDDHNGKVMSFVTSALEFEDHLYLGSLNSNFIGKLPLHSA